MKIIAVTGYLVDGTRVHQSFVTDSEKDFSERVNAWAERHKVVEWSRDSTA
jgi:hypothetical protein